MSWKRGDPGEEPVGPSMCGPWNCSAEPRGNARRHTLQNHHLRGTTLYLCRSAFTEAFRGRPGNSDGRMGAVTSGALALDIHNGHCPE